MQSSLDIPFKERRDHRLRVSLRRHLSEFHIGAVLLKTSRKYR